MTGAQCRAIQAEVEACLEKETFDPVTDWSAIEAKFTALKISKAASEATLNAILTSRAREKVQRQKNKLDGVEHGIRLLSQTYPSGGASGTNVYVTSNAKGQDMSSGDQNFNSGVLGNQGGHDNKADIGSIVQSGNQIDNTINWAAAATELGQIHAEMLKEKSDDPDHQIALGTVKAAELAAKKGDGNKALQYLKNGGKTVFDFAQKLAVPIVVEIFKQHLGSGVPHH